MDSHSLAVSGPNEGFSNVSTVGKSNPLKDSGMGQFFIDLRTVVKTLPNISKRSRERDSCLSIKSHSMKLRNSKDNFKFSSILEDELVKVIETGVGLGMDFNGKEVGMAEIFAEERRKKKLGEFPNEVLHLPFLRKLILSENIGLRGTFPVSNWSSPLRLFNLSFTSFSGKLPDTIGNLLNLKVLDLAFCNFEGPVPASFWNLTQITSLVLTSNHFTGQISTSLSNLVRLTDLYLRHNMFSGQFPDVFRNLRKVKYLDLSQNNFSDWEDNEGVFNESKMRNDKVFCLAAKGHGMKSRSSKLSWILEEEITKIINLGSALGFDFNDKEVRMSDVIAKAISKLKLKWRINRE
ncbi:hypothetical protein LWI29_011032 [Acer saccharum]|uniref:Uncharacterized protein n=1 Tax=Acer saccharum TaxID=4024 RepID=A0AA39T2A7_ACESA|nr:hypothetical protein LWI29_011032 [Acer saccharum]